MKRPFKIGERVVGGTKSGCWKIKGRISEINKNAIEIKSELGLFWFHRKEIRRLKPKKKPREWVLLLPKKSTGYIKIYNDGESFTFADEDYELVRVREVV